MEIYAWETGICKPTNLETANEKILVKLENHYQYELEMVLISCNASSEIPLSMQQLWQPPENVLNSFQRKETIICSG